MMHNLFTVRPVCMACCSLLAGLITTSAQAGINERIEDALKLDGGALGQIKFDLRYRYENVHEEDVPRETANASLLRLRLGYLTPEFQGVQGFVEMESNQDIGENDYNSTRNGKSRFSVVADPQEVELNQLWVSFNGIPDTLIKVGRQRIKYDNARFIGNVIWRNMEQTFDSVSLTNTSIPDLNIQAAFLWRAQDIFSKNVNMTSPLLNISYSGLEFGTVTAYGYWLDYEDAADSGNFSKSTQTYGISFNGSYPVNKNLKLHYATEYAYQSDYQSNPKSYQADYVKAEGGLTAFAVTGKGGVEFLSSDNGAGFQTPLATLHAFQGWADRFLVTPKDGIRDVYGSLMLKAFGTKFLAVYHDLDDDSGAINYGEEMDFLITRKFGKHYSLLLKYAKYNAKTHSADVQKFWIQGAISF